MKRNDRVIKSIGQNHWIVILSVELLTLLSFTMLSYFFAFTWDVIGRNLYIPISYRIMMLSRILTIFF
jgi:hypothetical protein